MPKTVVLILTIFVVLFLISCNNPGTSTEEDAPFVLEVAGSIDSAVSRASGRAQIGTVIDSREAGIYYATAPIVTGMKEAAKGVGNGSQSTVSVFDDSEATYTITRNGGVWRYSGRVHMAGIPSQETGWFELIYDVSSKTWDYEQYLILYDPDLVIQDEIAEQGDTIWIIYNKLTDVTMGDSGSNGIGEFFFLSFDYDEGESFLPVEGTLYDDGRPRVGSQYLKAGIHIGDDYSGIGVWNDQHAIGMIEDGENTVPTFAYPGSSTGDMRELGWDPNDIGNDTNFISYMNPTTIVVFDLLWNTEYLSDPLDDEQGFYVDKTVSPPVYVEHGADGDGKLPWNL